MTTEEFSNEFDILYNNVMSNQAPGLDEYEKSVFLTLAQKELVRAYFETTGNSSLVGFDGSEKRQYDFSNLIRNRELVNITDLVEYFNNSSSLSAPEVINTFDSRSYLFLAPPDYFLAVNEQIVDSINRIYNVKPILYTDYNLLISKPYGYPLKRQAWRLISDTTTYYNTVGYETITDDSDNTYPILIRSKYNKPLYITISIGENVTTTAPAVEELDDSVLITFKINSDDLVTYWQTYLISDSKLESAGLSDYIYPIDSANYNGLWPSSIGDETSWGFTMYIPETVTDTGYSIESPIMEVIGRFNGDFVYKMRYVKQPSPIILVDLEDVQEGLSIGGHNTVTECELPSNTHSEILQRAVELAKAYYTAGNSQQQASPLNDILSLRNSSITNIGGAASTIGRVRQGE